MEKEDKFAGIEFTKLCLIWYTNLRLLTVPDVDSIWHRIRSIEHYGN